MWAQAGSPAQSVAQRTRPNATATSRAAAGTRDSINSTLGLAMPAPPAKKRASPRRPPLARSDSSAVRAVWMAELQAEWEARAERMPPAPGMPAAVREDDELTGGGAWKAWYEPRPEAEEGSAEVQLNRSLLWAVSSGMHHLVAQLIENGASVLSPDAWGQLPLAAAAAEGHAEVADVLLHGGCTADERDARGRTALMFAAASGGVEMCEWLLNHGAGATAEDASGVTAAMVAAGGGHVDALRSLLEREPGCVALRDGQRMDALMWACRAGQAACVAELLERGANANGVDSRGRTALGWAAVSGQPDAVAMLCDGGAGLQRAEWTGRYAGATPLLLAIHCGRTAVTQALLERGADPAERRNDGRGALSAVASGLQADGGDEYSKLLRVLGPALLTAWNSADDLTAWLTHSGIPPDAIATLLASEQIYSESDGSLALCGDALAAFLQRLESMLRAADLQAWAEAAASPPATEQREDAASLIQFSARRWAARKQERCLQHGHAASVIQRRFKHFCASRIAAAAPPNTDAEAAEESDAADDEAEAEVRTAVAAEDVDHGHFSEIARRRKLRQIDSTALKNTIHQWGNTGHRLLLVVLLRWHRNVVAAQLMRKREAQAQVVGGRHAKGLARKTGSQWRRRTEQMKEETGLLRVKLEVLGGALAEQKKGVADVRELHTSIADCRKKLNDSYSEVERPEKGSSSQFMQYLGDKTLSGGSRIDVQWRHSPPATPGFSKTERALLRDGSLLELTSLAHRSLGLAETHISSGQQLLEQGNYHAAQAIFEAAKQAGEHSLKLHKAVGSSKHLGASDSGKPPRESGASSPDAERVQTEREWSRQRWRGLWKMAGSQVKIGNLLLRVLNKEGATSTQTGRGARGDGETAASTQADLKSQLSSDRFTAAFMQAHSAFQFRYSSRALVESAVLLREDAEQLIQHGRRLRAKVTHAPEPAPAPAKGAGSAESPGAENAAAQITDQQMEACTLMVHGLPGRAEYECDEPGSNEAALRQQMSQFGPVLAVTFRLRGKSAIKKNKAPPDQASLLTGELTPAPPARSWGLVRRPCSCGCTPSRR